MRQHYRSSAVPMQTCSEALIKTPTIDYMLARIYAASRRDTCSNACIRQAQEIPKLPHRCSKRPRASIRQRLRSLDEWSGEDYFYLIRWIIS